MLSGAKGRRAAAGIVEPVARFFLSLGLTPNGVTVLGTVVTVAIAVILIPLDHLFLAAVLSGVFSAFDMLDGAMARMTTGGSKFGAVLDASCDRITDGALFAAICMWLVYVDHAGPATVAACLIVLISSQVTSYVKARAEATGFSVSGGLVERPERLIIGLVGVGFEGLGVPYALEVALWLLVIGSIFTVLQRIALVKKRDSNARFKKELRQ
ncbi:phosphatidylglycerophosphate synthase [Corynebacterium phocae]|uniref:Phosphatidylinositol phosphate synthase n=1 Tax=Corynebacterium phocae TaxID=161895 RepID=A0A1L7D2R0_9CORY|nr:CDP-alcohol phosphatidyltransferase family protein [Corynebacterium phocae]APT92414.1 phosphatidylglycerophosphate synthase [Corynebacterium phocae]KAA8725009.1 CDP-alcohol phosphatidyltransferase family protein [Corynebacterium phocae]